VNTARTSASISLMSYGVKCGNRAPAREGTANMPARAPIG
jgi:hypothetical protein